MVRGLRNDILTPVPELPKLPEEMGGRVLLTCLKKAKNLCIFSKRLEYPSLTD